MKTKFNLIILFLALLPILVKAQSQIVTANIKVNGNCTMCKKRIENALDRKGVKQANWNPKTKNLRIIYNSSRITEQQIHEWIAAAGHDTDKVKAKDEVYAKLPFCCLYRDGESAATQLHHP